MKTTVVLSTLIAIIVCNCATAAARKPRSQPWLSALTFSCRGSVYECVGVVLDRQWVLTTANCFSKCKTEIPTQLSVHVNIPPMGQRRITLAMRMGNKVNGTLAWQHPEYDSETFANNLALVKLDCHDHALQKLNLASNCNSADESQESNFNGYMLLKNTAIKFNNADGDKAKCFSSQGTATWYYSASTLQMVATKSRGSLNCMETLICKHTEELKYFMQGNEPNCTNSTLPPSRIPANISDQAVKNNNTISTQHTVTSVVMSAPSSPKASQMPTPTQAVVLSTRTPMTAKASSQTQVSTDTSTSTSTQDSTLTKMSTSTEAPTSTVIPIENPIESSTLIQVPVSTVIPFATPTEGYTSIQNPLSTETSILTPVSATFEILTPLPSSTQLSVSTSASASSQLPVLTKIEVSTEAPTILPTPTSTETSTFSQNPSLTVIPSTQVPTATPTENTTSGCQLNISNGETHAATIIPGFILITYTCNPGYNFEVGVMQITYGCTNGVMSSKPLPCKRITCPPIEPFANGTVAVSGLTIDSTATYKCNEGFILSGGYTVRVCGANHQWSGNTGVCKRVCSFPDPLVCNDGHKIYATTLRYGQIGESTSYKVTDGYYLIGEAPVCQPDSTWSAPPKCIKLCNENQVYPHATILIQRNASTYTRKIECSEGYKAIGATEQQCSDRGTWNPYFQECAKTCGQISLVNGTVSMFESASFLIALMKCDEGFHLHPPLSAVRCSNAKWIPGIPSCVEDN